MTTATKTRKEPFGRPRKANPRNTAISATVSYTERDRIQAFARKAGKPVGPLLREIILEHIESSETTERESDGAIQLDLPL